MIPYFHFPTMECKYVFTKSNCIAIMSCPVNTRLYVCKYHDLQKRVQLRVGSSVYGLSFVAPILVKAVSDLRQFYSYFVQNSGIHLLSLICDWQEVCLRAKLTKVSKVLHYSCLGEEPFVFTIIDRIGKAGPCSGNFRQCWKKKWIIYFFLQRKRSKLGQFIS